MELEHNGGLARDGLALDDIRDGAAQNARESSEAAHHGKSLYAEERLRDGPRGARLGHSEWYESQLSLYESNVDGQSYKDLHDEWSHGGLAQDE